MLLEKYEYKYMLAQAAWNPNTNDTDIFPDLNEHPREGWRIIKIVPREKDFSTSFLNVKYQAMPLSKVKATISYSIHKGPNLFKTIEYEVPSLEQSLIYLFITEDWRELNSGNLEVYGITFNFREPIPG